MNLKTAIQVTTIVTLFCGAQFHTVAYAEQVIKNTQTKALLAKRSTVKLHPSKWPASGTLKPGSVTIYLTPGECRYLGGTVQGHAWCGKTKKKCVIGKKAVCISELDEEF